MRVTKLYDIIETNDDQLDNDRIKLLDIPKNRKNNFKRYLYCIILLMIIILTSIFIYLYIYNYFQEPCYIINDDIKLIKSNTTIHSIILYGDSLIQKPIDFYHLDCHLLNKVKKRFPYLRFELISEGQGGSRIEKLKYKLQNSIINQQPEAVIMYWDSDVSDPHLGYVRSKEGIDLYTQNLIDVVISIKSMNSLKYFAISGPEVLGELPDLMNKKDPYLNIYRDINRKIAQEYNASYIDIRKAFLDEDRRFGWIFNKGYLTFDGEHPSQIGSELEEKLFFNQIEKWYSNVNT